MRRLLPLLLSLSLTFPALSSAKNSVEQQIRTIAAFHSIEVDGAFDVTITTGKVATLTVSADKQLLPWISTTVSGDQLSIALKEGVKPHYQHRPNIQVSLSELESIVASNHAKIVISSLHNQSFNLGLDNHSELTLSQASVKTNLVIAATNHSHATVSGEAKNLLINGSNHCDINADEMTTAAATINLLDHSTAVVSTQQVTVNESNHCLLKLGPETTKIRGHLHNHSTIDSPQSDTTESFITNDTEFD